MSFIIAGIQKYWNGILDFIYPGVCCKCKSSVPGSDVLICDECWARLPRNERLTLYSGDRYLTRKKYFSFVTYRFEFGNSEYGAAVRDLIHLFKFSYYPFLSKRIGSEMVTSITNTPELAGADALVPVPLHKARLRDRGFNQSLLLAEVVSESVNIPVEGLLERIVNRRPQSSISDNKQKEKNVQGIFAVRNGSEIKNKKVILIDDLFTTGSTANECAKVLKKSGAGEVYVVTAACAV